MKCIVRHTRASYDVACFKSGSAVKLHKTEAEQPPIFPDLAQSYVVLKPSEGISHTQNISSFEPSCQKIQQLHSHHSFFISPKVIYSEKLDFLRSSSSVWARADLIRKRDRRPIHRHTLESFLTARVKVVNRWSRFRQFSTSWKMVLGRNPNSQAKERWFSSRKNNTMQKKAVLHVSTMKIVHINP